MPIGRKPVYVPVPVCFPVRYCIVLYCIVVFFVPIFCYLPLRLHSSTTLVQYNLPSLYNIRMLCQKRDVCMCSASFSIKPIARTKQSEARREAKNQPERWRAIAPHIYLFKTGMSNCKRTEQAKINKTSKKGNKKEEDRNM